MRTVAMAEHSFKSQSMSREDLAAFVEQFANNLVEEPEDWENDNLERFLRALSA